MMASRQELHGKPMFQTENFEARAGMAAGTSHGNEGPPVGPYVPNSNLLESVRAKMISTNDLISKFNKKSGEVEILERQMAERATCVDNLKEQNQLYTQQLTTALMESNSIKTDLLKHKDQIGALQVERERLLATNEHQKYQIEALQKTKTQFSHKVDDLERSKQQLDEQVKSLAARNKQASSEIQSLNTKLANQGLEFDKQKTNLTRVRQQFGTYQSKFKRLLKFADTLAGLLEKQNLFSPLLKKSLKKFNVETGPNEEIVSPKSDSDDEEDQMGAQLEALLTASTGFDESSDGISAQNLNESLESLDESVIRQSNQLSLAQKHRKIDNQVKLTSTHKQVVEADSTQSLTESPSPRSQQLIPSLKNSPGPPISSNFIVPRTSPLVKSQPNRLLTESKVPTKKESLPVVKEKVVDELKPCVITPVHKPNPVREFKRREVVRTPKVVQKIPAYLPPVEIEKRAINEVMSALDREIFAYIRPPMSPIRDWSVIPLLEEAESKILEPTNPERTAVERPKINVATKADEIQPNVNKNGPSILTSEDLSVPNDTSVELSLFNRENDQTNVDIEKALITSASHPPVIRKPLVVPPLTAKKTPSLIVQDDLPAATRTSFRPCRPGVRKAHSPLKPVPEEKFSVTEEKTNVETLTAEINRCESTLSSTFEGFTQEDNEVSVDMAEIITDSADTFMLDNDKSEDTVKVEKRTMDAENEHVDTHLTANPTASASTIQPDADNKLPVTFDLEIPGIDTEDDSDVDVDDIPISLSIDVEDEPVALPVVEKQNQPMKTDQLPQENGTDLPQSYPAKRKLPEAFVASAAKKLAKKSNVEVKTPKQPLMKKPRLEHQKLGIESINSPVEFVQLGKKPPTTLQAGWAPTIRTEPDSFVKNELKAEIGDWSPSTSVSCCIEDIKVNQAAQRWVESNLEKLLKNSIQTVTFMKQMESSHHKFSTPVFVQSFIRAIVDRAGDILPALYTACARRNPVTMPYLSNDEHKLFKLISELTADKKFPDLRSELASELTRRLLTVRFNATQQNAICRVVAELRRQLNQPGRLSRVVYELLFAGDENVINMLISMAGVWNSFFLNLLTNETYASLAQLFLHLVASKQDQMRAKIEVVLESVVGYTSSPTALDLKELLTEILSALEITPGFFAAATTTEFRVSDDVFPQLAKFLLLAQYVDLRPFGERWVKDIHMYKSPGEFCQAEADYTAKSIYLLGLCGSKAFQFGNDIAAQKKLSRLLSSLEMILTSEKNRDCLLIQYCVAHCILRLAAIAPTFTSSVLTYWLSEKRGQIPKTLQDRFNRFHQIFNSKKKL